MFKDLAASVIFVDVSIMTVDIVLKSTCIIVYTGIMTPRNVPFTCSKIVPSIHYYYYYFLRYDMMLIMNLLHAVSVIIVDAPIQNVYIVLTCTVIMAHGAQDT